MKFIYLKIKKKEWGCKISPATPVGTCRLHAVGRKVREAPTAAATECEVVVLDVVFRSPALLAPLRLHFLHLRHRFATAPSKPPGLLAEDSWIVLAPLLADVFPLRHVVKAPAMNTLTVGTLIACKIVMVHNNPPFWPPVFLGATCNHTRNQKKVKGNKKSASLPFLILKVMDSWIKIFSFLLSKSPIRFYPQN